MAVHIKLIRNNIKSNCSYGKYFAKAVSQGEVSLKEIAAEACRNSGFSEGSVIGVTTELQDLLKQKLSEGQSDKVAHYRRKCLAKQLLVVVARVRCHLAEELPLPLSECS